jgi:hypothetical protein
VTRDRETFMTQVLVQYSLGGAIPEPRDAEEHRLAQALMRNVDRLRARGRALRIPTRMP